MLEDKKEIAGIYAHKAPIFVAAVTVLCLAPFINKAFHIDDTLFLWSAKQIQKNPVDFYGFTVNWYGTEAPMSVVTKNPPITGYYIALAAWLFGWSEIALHLVFLIPAAAAALGTYYLAEKLCSRPVLAALAAILTPGFLVSGTNIMCDTMMLAFWLWAILLWMQGIEKNNFSRLFFASILIAVCSLTKYFGMALLPLLFAYSLFKKRSLGNWVLFLLIPAAILAGYQWLTYNLYGRGLLSDAAEYATSYNPRQGLKWLYRSLTGLFFTGGCVITAMFYIPVLWSKRVLISGTVIMVLFMFALNFMGEIDRFSITNLGNEKWGFLIQAGLMAAAGINVLWLTIADFHKDRNAESMLLSFWIIGTFIFAAFINWTGNARSLLPMIPAVGILVMRQIGRTGSKTAKHSDIQKLFWPLIPAAIVALLVCWADYSWAGSMRSAAKTIHKPLANSDQTIWFQGHWGFQYYMEAAGGKALDFKNPQIALADIVIMPLNNSNIRYLSEETAYLSEVLHFTSFHGLAVMNWQLGAGFYTDLCGPLPYVVGAVDPDIYYIYIVRESAFKR
jgi:4-amino-4-deoxy-L-arabinose transferase-like glycosyltransferase